MLDDRMDIRTERVRELRCTRKARILAELKVAKQMKLAMAVSLAESDGARCWMIA